MIISTKGVELNDTKYIDFEGKFLFQIEKWEEDGVNYNGDIKFKIHFKGIEVGKKEQKYIHTENFSLATNMLWKIKQLEVALKSPEIYDLESWKGRFIVANVKAEPYEKNGETKTAYRVKSWEYSQFNDKLSPIPEAQHESSDDSIKPIETEIMSDEECPF